MKYIPLLKVSLKALRSNKSRALLTMLGVIIGVVAVILLVSIGNGLKTFITKQLEDLGSNLVVVLPGEIDVKNFSFSAGSQAALAGLATSKLKIIDAENIKRDVPLLEETVAITLQQSSNLFPRKLLSFQGNKEYLDLFYQKSVTNHSVGGCGEEKGFKGKGNRRSRLRWNLL